MDAKRLWTLILVGVSGCAAARASGGPDQRPVTDPKSIASVANSAARPAPIDDLYYTRNVFGPAWSPNGTEIVFTSDMAGRPNLWKVKSSGGWPVQLTQSDDRQYNAVWSPDGRWIVYQQDRAGNELWDLYTVPSDGGQIVNLTNTPDVREQDPRFSHDGKTIAFGYKPKDGTQYDIALLDWSSRKVRKLTNEHKPGYSWSIVAWSSDDKAIYANRIDPPFTDADLYQIDVKTGKSDDLTPHHGTVRYLGSALSPDGRTLLLSSDAKNGYMNVALLDIASKKITWATDTKWEAFSGNYSPDGKHFTYVVNEDGVTNAFLADCTDNRAEKVDLPHGLNLFAGNRMSFRRTARASSFRIRRQTSLEICGSTTYRSGMLSS